MDEDRFQPIPETAEEMAVRWAQRDAEYAKMRPAPSSDMVAAVRDARKREANRLPVADRARMWTRANNWVPPVNPDFGSMKDFLE